MSRAARILVADDNDTFRTVVEDILTRAGYEVIVADDGLTAFEKTVICKPDVVITDGLMPRMHGFLLCKTVKQLEPPPKVIVVTAVYTRQEYREEVIRKYGADELLTKPCRIGDLFASIERLLWPTGEQGEETGRIGGEVACV